MPECCFYCGSQPSVFPGLVFCPTESCKAKDREDLWLWNNTQKNLKIYHDTKAMVDSVVADMQAQGRW